MVAISALGYLMKALTMKLVIYKTMISLFLD